MTEYVEFLSKGCNRMTKAEANILLTLCNVASHVSLPKTEQAIARRVARKLIVAMDEAQYLEVNKRAQARARMRSGA